MGWRQAEARLNSRISNRRNPAHARSVARGEGVHVLPTGAAMFEFLSQPLAVAAVILLSGIHAAVWLLVFERMGYPRLMAALMFVPPLTLFLPVVLALTRWPAAET